MSILIEAITVVLKHEAIQAKYPGGFEGFVRNAPDLCSRQTLVCDEEIVGLSFMAPADVEAFCNGLSRFGFSPASNPVDLVVVDQLTGPTAPCTWIEAFTADVGDGQKVAAARLVGGREESLFVPDGWSYENSLTAHHVFTPLDAVADLFEFVREEAGMEVWRERATGEERYIERPVRPG